MTNEAFSDAVGSKSVNIRFSELDAVMAVICSCKNVYDIFSLVNSVKQRLQNEIVAYLNSSNEYKPSLYQYMFLKGLMDYFNSGYKLNCTEDIAKFSKQVETNGRIPWLVGLLQGLLHLLTDPRSVKKEIDREESMIVLVSVFNDTRFSELCFKSIRKFTSSPYHILAVNNSTMNIEHFKEKAVKEKLVDTWFDSGQIRHGDGLQAAMKYAQRFRYIAVVDSDVVGLRDGWLDDLVDQLRNSEAGLIGYAGGSKDNIHFLKVHPSCMVIEQNITSAKFEINFRDSWPVWDTAGLVTWDCLAHGIDIIKLSREYIDKAISHYGIVSRLTLATNEEEMLCGKKVREWRKIIDCRYAAAELDEIKNYQVV